MRIKDIARQNGKWVHQCQIYIEAIGSPQETQHGLCQAITAVFDGNMTETINYFFSDSQFAIEPSETGRQWYDIRTKGDYYQCKPCDAKKEVSREDDTYPDWDAIALGKCRHKHIDRLLQRMMPTELVAKPKELEAINKLVAFEATGTLT